MRSALCSFFALMTLATGVTRANVTYSYTATPLSSTTISVGGSVMVQLYLTETITTNTSGGNSNQSLIGLDGGVTSAGVFVNTTSGSGPTITSFVNNVVATTNGTNFDTANKSGTNSLTRSSATQAGTLESVTNSPTNAGQNFSTSAVTSTTTNQILLGTLTITGTSAGTTNYAIESFANAKNTALYTGLGVAANGNTSTAGASVGPLDLDSTNNLINGGGATYAGAGTTGATGAVTFSVTVQPTSTPEPSSMLLCGFAACGMGVGAWRRRKAKLAAQTVEIEA